MAKEARMSNKKILLVEDDITLGDLIVFAMTKRDYQVTWYVRARLDQSGALIFMNDRGVETSFDSADNKENGHGYDLALVDSRLKGSDMQGFEVTQELTKRGVTVIGSSGLPYLNQQLVKAGAVGCIEKHEIFNLIKDEGLLRALTLQRL
jgi:DNA-binding response OmpR family regulator